jgi:biotin carboxylase
MTRVLVVLPTQSYRAPDFLEAAEALGIDVTIATETALPLTAADRAVVVDMSHPEQAAERIVSLASATPIDAVIAVDDRGLPTAARAAAILGLPHHTVEAVETTLDKGSMRTRLARAEVPQPDWKLLEAGGDPGSLFTEFGGPVVIKPLSLSASRGVIRADTAEAALVAADRIRAIQATAGCDPDAPLLFERYVDGPEVAVEAIAWDGEIEILAHFDKPDPLEGPYFEETIYVTPSRNDPALLAEIERVTATAAAALDLDNGPIHAELRLPQGRPVVIEVAARTIGGACSRSLRFGLGSTSLETLVIRQALGLRKHLSRAPGASGVMMLPIPGRGRLEAVSGRDRCLSEPGITDLEISIPVGEDLVPLPEGDRYLGFLFARGDTPEAVEDSLRRGHALLEFRIG